MPSKPDCPDCGASTQANHSSLWLSSTGDVLTMGLPMHRLPFYRLLARLGEWFLGLIGRTFFTLGRFLNVITLTTDSETATTNRSKLLWLEAKRRGIRMEQLLFLGKPTDSFRIRHHGRTQFFKSLPLNPPGETLRMDDKVLFKRMLANADLPAPRSVGVSSYRDAKKALRNLELVCVKPRSGSNGRHTFPYVRTEEELSYALTSVHQICAYASVEEHLEGNLCRATCVGGVMHGFLDSQYPKVTGDGVSTVSELIAQKNAVRGEGVGEIVPDASMEGYIARRGYALGAVLPKGETLQLTYRAGAAAGGSNYEHGSTIHPSFIEPIERAARLTGLAIVGFDIIIPNPREAAESQRWGFVEANSLPWIDLHATPFLGTPNDLSAPVWELWERQYPARGTR